MSFIWPSMLGALVVVPILAAGYAALQRRRVPLSTRRTRRRHVPVALFLGAVALMAFGLARPQATIDSSRRLGTVILAFDVSNSMLAADVEPTRIAAAQEAADDFVGAQPDNIQIGVVAFGNGALITQQPTTSHADVLGAIKRLKPSGGTSIGFGILTSMSAIVGKPIVLPPTSTPDDGNLDGAPDPFAGLDLGYFGSATIVLLSDGEDTGGPDPVALAGLAAKTGVHISTIGLGSTDGAVITVDGFQVATALDEPLLQQIADTTNGIYERAADARQLDAVYRSINLRTVTQPKKTEITAWFAGGAVVLLLAGAFVMMRWFGRIV
jgi:Ca-activated chloride channel homolog